MNRYGPNTYCNLEKPARPEPRAFKPYRDSNACAPLGCERAGDCPAPNTVCNSVTEPPACVRGCFESEADCQSGFLCRDAPEGKYSQAECRALEPYAAGGERTVGTCCDPGCLDRVTQCRIGEFCCGEPDSPYEEAESCLAVTSTETIPAAPGQCTEHDRTFCTACDLSARLDNQCNSGWTAGYNIDSAINEGAPFQEQEFCAVTALGLTCSVTCNPRAQDNGCPGRYPCLPLYYGCLTDQDCGGLECIGEDLTADPIRQGYCKCGEDGTVQATCPSNPALVGPGPGGFVNALPVRLPSPTPSESHEVAHPRCVAGGPSNQGGAANMVCIASYSCIPGLAAPKDFPGVCIE